MTRISRYKVKDDVMLKIYQLFFEVFSKSSYKKKSFFTLIDEILSPTEKIMIAKRVAVAYLLKKGISHRNIAFALKTSTATSTKFSDVFSKKDSMVNSVVTRLLKKEQLAHFLDDLLHDLFTQPGIRRGHWEVHWEHKKYKQRERRYGI